MSLEIRRATRADQTAIGTFIASAYGDLAPYKGPARWAWQFLENPFCLPTDDGIPVWIAVDDAAVVGQIAVQSAEFKLGSAIHSGGWIVDVMIDPVYRGKGLGHLLQEAVYRDFPLALTLTMAQATRRMAERLGAISFGPVWQFSRWERFSKDDVRRFLAQRAVHRHLYTRSVRFFCRYFAADSLIASALNIGLVARDLFAKAARPTDLKILEIDRFGGETDDLWKTISAEYPAISSRDSRFLNWRFADCPQLRYRRFLAYQSDVVIGYLVLRFTEPEELRQGVIVDLMASRRDRDTLARLVVYAVGVFKNRVASIECGTSIPEISAALRASGFFVSRIQTPTALTASTELRADIENCRAGWFLSKADSDWDQIHLA
jgi:GNAT superfamily N-acetyltransferase